MIKHIMPLIFIGLLVTGCDDKDSTIASENPAHDPSSYNEIQQDLIEIAQNAISSGASRSDGSVDFWSDLATNLGNALGLGIPCAVDQSMCGTARTAATAALVDHIGEVMASVKAHAASSSMDQLKASMDDLDAHEMIHSAAYQALRDQLADVLTEAHTNYTGAVNHYHDLQDADIRSLETTALNTLSRNEYNTFIAHSQPVLQTHAMFESGIWDDLSDAYGDLPREQEQVFMCFVAAVSMVLSVEVSNIITAPMVAPTIVIPRSDASAIINFDPDILNAALGAGVSASQTQLHHAANIIGFAGGLLDLLENHAE